MYLYFIVLCVLSVGVFLEVISPKKLEKSWGFLWIVLSVFLMCRYGQGSDYTGYQTLYEQIIQMRNLGLLSGIHTEIGWKVLCLTTYAFSLQFFQFVMMISIIELFFLYRFIKLYCPYKIFALFLIFPTLYLTYLFSALRQGLVICIFLGGLLPLLLHKKYVCYWLGCFLCITIHMAALVFFFFPLIDRIKRLSLLHLFIILSIVIGLTISVTDIGQGLSSLFQHHMEYYYNNTRNEMFIPLCERIISYLVVFFLFIRYRRCNPKATNLDLLNKLMKLYLVGMIMYGLWLWIPLIASRLSCPLKALEIALVCQMMSSGSLRKIIYLYFIPLVFVMYFKNMNSYIQQGRYRRSVTVVNFPYVSIFNRKDILKWRDVHAAAQGILD